MSAAHFQVVIGDDSRFCLVRILSVLCLTTSVQMKQTAMVIRTGRGFARVALSFPFSLKDVPREVSKCFSNVATRIKTYFRCEQAGQPIAWQAGVDNLQLFTNMCS